MKEALGTYWAKTKDLAKRGGHFVRRSENIHGYVTSAAVDNQANKPPKLFVMTEKWSSLSDESDENWQRRGWEINTNKQRSVKHLFICKHNQDSLAENPQMSCIIWRQTLLPKAIFKKEQPLDPTFKKYLKILLKNPWNCLS